MQPNRIPYLLLLFPLGGLILFVCNRLFLHNDAMFITAIVAPMTLIPTTAIALCQRWHAPRAKTIKVAVVSILLVVLFSLIELL